MPSVIYIYRYFTYSLCSIGKEQHTMLSGNSADFSNRLYNANFIISIHDRYQNSRWS